jgi:hypothetical protein
MFKRIIVAFGLLSMFISVYSQDSKDKQVLSVTLDIAGKGAPTCCAKVSKYDYYFATVNILNTQDTTVSIWVMSCSWPMETFAINSQNIVFRYCFGGCDYNVPDEIKIPPKKSVQFYGTIVNWNKDSSIAHIKVGFKYFRTFDDLWNADASKQSERPYTMIWSNEVELKDKMYTYEIK